jgi:hypothetical protein
MVNMTKSEAQKKPRRRWVAGLFWSLAMLLSGAFAVWQGMIFFSQPIPTPAQTMTDTAAYSANPHEAPMDVQSILADGSSHRAGLRKVQALPPAGLPPSAKLESALGRPSLPKGTVELIWRYDATSLGEGAGESLGDALVQRGYRRLSSPLKEQATRQRFSRGDETVDVVLRSSKKKDTIGLTVIEYRTGRPDDFFPAGKERK